MTPRRLTSLRSRAAAVLAGSLLCLATMFGTVRLATAQPTVVAPASEAGPLWQDLAAGHRAVLKPLERDWRSIGGEQKQKWIELAARFPALSPEARGRVQARMTEWAQMSPRERGQARINFQEAQQVSPQDRQSQWEAYQALPPDQKRQLAARAAPAPKETSHPSGATSPRPSPGGDPADDTPAVKSNIVPNPAHAQPLRQVTPTVVQAQPGATTTLITKRPAPPAHQQTGLPKIAATPEFVDKATLLPQRGPQGAATRSAAASGAQMPLRR